jgi:D-alanine-D-alanine ligase
MYAKLWDASGVKFPELVTRLVELAHERFAERQRSLQAAREVALHG